MSGDLDLRAYRAAFGTIHGAFAIDAALLFFAYGVLLEKEGLRGSVMEIGVHHGLSAIAVAALRAPGARMIAIDQFGTSADVAASGAMSSDERTFRANVARFHGDLAFLKVIAADSRSVGASAMGGGEFSFCHIDGGHSPEETESDLALSTAASKTGGLIALDDYFNPSFPGVSEGTVRFLLEHPGTLTPIAIGANKVIFRRGPAGDINARFVGRYPFIPRTRVLFSGSEVLHFGSGVARYVDLERSTPSHLVARELALRVDLDPAVRLLEVSPGGSVPLEIQVRNRSNVPLDWSDSPFGLSYHVLRTDGSPERYENARTWFIPPLEENSARAMTLDVVAPERPGDYLVEADVVWEGICWLRERGNATARVPLKVR